MLWTLWDVVVPMTVAFVAGLLLGWLLWRWQRTRISAEELHRLRSDTGRLRADNDRLRERLVDSQGRSRQRAERKDNRSPDLTGKRLGQSGGIKTRAAMEPERRSDEESTDSPRVPATTLDNVDELRQAVEARDRMIDTLRHSLAQQPDEADPALMAAELSARDRKINALEDLLSAQQLRHSES